MRIEIEKKDKLYQLDADPGEPLLFAGLRAGIPLPYECATGTCGTCRARLAEGEIDLGWSEAPGKKNHKAEKKDLLLCQAHGKSDCKLVVPARIQAFRADDISPDYVQGKTSKWQYLTEDVIRFDVKLDSHVQFHPGQFFVLQVPGIEGYRAYSMVNYVNSTNSLEFIIKLKPGGVFSQWAEQQSADQSGGQSDVRLFGPLGRASFHADEDHDLTLITGGSGIAGLMSIIEQAVQLDYLQKHKIKLFFGVRTMDDLFFADRLMAVKDLYPDNFSVHVVLSMQQIEDADCSIWPEFEFSSGMVHEAALGAFSGDNSNTMVYMAGPQPMVDAAVRPLVLEVKVSPTMIRFDKFS